SRDQPLLVGRQREPLPAPRSPGDAASLPFGVDDLDRFDPAPHAAASHRPRPRCVGGHHAARGRERAGGRVGREAQAEGSRGGRQLAPRDGGTGPQPPARPVGRDPVESLAQVHDDALPDAPARHPAPRTPRHEPGARRCRPPHELLQLLHAPRHGDRCRDDPIDPGAFRVCGSAANIGQEWDEWDGRPLPENGDFSAPPGLFFRFAALTIGIGMALGAALIFLLGPRLGTLWPLLPRTLWLALGAAATATWLWFGTLVFSFYAGVLALPEGWLERGPYLRLMTLTSHLSRAFGKRDWVEHAAIDVYNTLAERRGRTVGSGELLVLIPRCLSKQALDGVLAIAGRYEVPVFVATRGQLARRVIRERRPRAVVAVACERDMMTGLRDVAGRLPVLGLTMRLPNGPCRDAMLDLDVMERWVKTWVGA